MSTSTRLLLAAAGLAFLAVVLWMWSGHLTDQQRLLKTAERCCQLANQREYRDACRHLSPELKKLIDQRAGGLAAAIRIAADRDNAEKARYSVGRITRWEPDAGAAEVEILRRTDQERKPEAIAVPWQRSGGGWEVAPALLDSGAWDME